jgi:hypothetical protein
MKYLVILAWLWSASSAIAEQPKLPLLEDVTVQGATVRLSDLLPPAMPADLTLGIENTVVGRSPEPGSVRVLSGATIRASLAAKSPFEVPAVVVVHRQEFPIELEAVVEALKDSSAGKRIDFSRARIRIPAGFAARVPKPQLELLSLMPGFDRATLIASLRCRERSACGRFVAEITVPDVSTDDDSLMAAHSYIAVSVSRLSAAYSTGPFLVQPGTPAWLVIEDSGMKIMEKVMPLRKGRVGETVRVRDVTAHRILVGQVIGEKLLRPAIGGAEIRPERTR